MALEKHVTLDPAQHLPHVPTVTPVPAGTPLAATPSRIFPVVVLAAVWIVFLARGLDGILIPPLAALALIYLLLPFNHLPWAARTMGAVFLLALIWLLAKVMAIVWIVGLALFLAYVMNPAATWMERKGIKRSHAALYLIFPAFAVLVLAAWIIIPQVYSQGSSFISDFPAYVATLTERYKSSFSSTDLENFPIDIPALLASFSESARNMISGASKGILGIAKRIGTVLSILVITPIVGFHLLKDFPGLQRNSLRMVPRRYEGEVLDLFSEMDILIGRWLRGQIIVSFIVGTLTIIGLSIVGLPYAVLIGALAGLLNMVPIVGYWISLLVAVVVALSTGDPARTTLWVAVIFFIVQMVEQNYLSPKIMGDQTGLHPVAILLSLLIFGSLLGLAGALLAIPFTLFLRVFYRRYLRRRVREAGSSATIVTPGGLT
jgi:predicted PurR-regulated permease PerM